MTKEQIAGLEGAATDLGCVVYAHMVLPRLLEERKRLLIALKWQRECYGVVDQGAAAIAYAEEAL